MNVPPTDSDRLNAVYDALTCAYRRQVLEYLVSAEGDVAAVAELVAHLVDHDGIDDDRSQVVITLHHVALPKLDALGFIEYDHHNRTVRYQESPMVERELRRDRERRRQSATTTVA